MESCNVMRDNARHDKETPKTSIQSAGERRFSCYESSSDEEDDDDDEFAFDTDSLTDFIHCMDGFESDLEEIYYASESDND